MTLPIFMRYKLLSFLCLFLLFVQFSNGQEPDKIKKLQQTLKKAKGKEKVKTLNQLCWAYHTSDLKKSIVYSKKALKLAKKINFAEGQADALGMRGIVERNKGDYIEAFNSYNKALNVAKENNLEVQLAYNQNNLGEIYKFLGDYSLAINYTEKAITTFKKLKNEVGISYGYIRLGEIYEAQERYEKSLEFFQKSLDIRQKIDDKGMIESSITRLGKIYSVLKQYNKAKEYFEEGLKLSKETGTLRGIAQNLNGLANIYHREGKNKKATGYATRSLEIAQKQGNKAIIKSASEILSEVYEKTLNFKKAYFYQNIVLQYKDSLINEDKRKAIQGLELKNELKRKDAEKARLAKEQMLNKKIIDRQKWAITLIIIGLGLLIALAIVLLRSNQQKQKNNRLLFQQKEEISEQAEEIKQQSKILDKERQKADDLLLNILPYQVAKELKASGTSKVKSYDIVSILFTDFKGFTKLASQMSEDKLIQELNECFTAFDEIIKTYQIEKIKTIGDAYMCVGGLPESNQTNPIDAVLAGLQIQEYMQERKKTKASQGEEYWECRLGINTGSVRAGVIGKSKFAYDVWGDSVNIASRMESGGQVNRVNISHNTYEYIKDFFDCEFRGEIEVKNGLMLKMYFVNRIKADYSLDLEGTKPNEKLYLALT